MLNVIRMKPPEENSPENLMLKFHELSINHNHKDYPKNAMHVFATNAEAALWNETMLNYLEGEVYTSVTHDCRKDSLANIANVVFSKLTP